jgi:oxygen-independent coproporphyrinogen-3 oxidase
VPYWNDTIDVKQWENEFSESSWKANTGEGISLYIHLPFCESLCTYCGCNKKITTNHGEEDEYLLAIKKEWQLYLGLMSHKPLIRSIHLGGGTPTFFSPENLSRLIHFITDSSEVHPQYEFSIEGHPNNTTEAHLRTLFSLGFKRVSYGVQDHNEEVQRIINRIQPFESVKTATETARKIGFESINYDLIYGLPLQNLERMEKTIQQTLLLRPDRIAFYSYAHVPWKSRSQRLFDESHLPTAKQKLELYRLGKSLFTENGYYDIGMDHFALPNDELNIAKKERRLHRNFMGYTTQHTDLLLGLGVSSISDTGSAFAQNEKTVMDYYQSLEAGRIPVFKGFFLTEEDKIFKRHILDISCNGATVLNDKYRDLLAAYSFSILRELEKDKLIEWNQNKITVTNLGGHFIRNICYAFDLHLLRDLQSEKAAVFSKAI